MDVPRMRLSKRQHIRLDLSGYARSGETWLVTITPLHIHCVTHVRDGGDLIRLINGFKSFSTRVWWNVGGSGPLWQRSFHDRGLRTPTDVGATVAYVWENPVRWGLADDDGNCPFRGGVLLETP